MFWKNVKLELEYQGLLVKELANKTGLNFNSLCNSMSKNSVPNAESALKIADALNVSVEYLLTGKSQNSFSNEEVNIIQHYRCLSADNKKIIKAIISQLSGIAAEITPDDNLIITK